MVSDVPTIVERFLIGMAEPVEIDGTPATVSTKPRTHGVRKAQLVSGAVKLPSLPMRSVCMRSLSRQGAPPSAVRCFFHAAINRGKSRSY